MNRYRKFIPVIVGLVVLAGAGLEKLGVDVDGLLGNSNNQSSYSGGSAERATKHWSSTNPEINLWHVFDGEINRSGKPTGYHSRPGGSDAPNARVKRIRDKPNKSGVYTAEVEVRDGNRWKTKNSSFFPDHLSQQEVIDVILHAFNNSSNQNAAPWSGPSGDGYTVQGYTSNRGGINTAYPLYNRNQ